MANYTCEFSKIKDGDSTKYVQVPNENTAKRNTLVFADDFNHTPLRNLDKYKITVTTSVDNPYYDEDDEESEKYIITTVTYSREFKSDINSNEVIYCAFTSGVSTIYIKHDDLTDKDKEDAGAYDVYIRGDDDANGNATFTKDATTPTPYTFLWL